MGREKLERRRREKKRKKEKHRDDCYYFVEVLRKCFPINAIPHTNWNCYFCGGHKTYGHILFDCPKVLKIWILVFERRGKQKM